MKLLLVTEDDYEGCRVLGTFSEDQKDVISAFIKTNIKDVSQFTCRDFNLNDKKTLNMMKLYTRILNKYNCYKIDYEYESMDTKKHTTLKLEGPYLCKLEFPYHSFLQREIYRCKMFQYYISFGLRIQTLAKNEKQALKISEFIKKTLEENNLLIDDRDKENKHSASYFSGCRYYGKKANVNRMIREFYKNEINL